jgi:hypothetical protein
MGGLVACANEELPAPAEQTVGAPAPAVATEAAPTPDEPCAPGTTRECRLSYRDAEGQVHCPAATQFCRSDGAAWLPCGVREVPDGG